MNWTLLMQAVPTAPESSWGQILSVLASMGFAVWYAYHTTTKTIPDMQATHAQTVKAITETIKTITDEFRSEAKEQRLSEAKRAETAAELARSGHAAVAQITAAVGELRTVIQQSDIFGARTT